MKEKQERRQSIIKAIAAIYRFSQTYLGPRLKKFDLGKGQWYFLNQLLFDSDGYYQEELSQKLFTDKGNTARALKKLEDNGYITRQEDSKDKRRKKIYVTDKARQIEDDFHQVAKDLNEILAKDLTQKERQEFLRILYIIYDNIQEYRD